MSKHLNLACHPHPLTLREGTGVWFRCKLCISHGYGSFYHCYQIHDTCADAPLRLSFFGHTQHPLVLEPAIPDGSGLCCSLCTYCIHGIYYACRSCGFFLHPVCARLPPSSASPVHPQHLVTLVPGESRDCSSCGGRCGGWYYTCAPCGINLHTLCLLGDPKNDHKVTPLCICG